MATDKGITKWTDEERLRFIASVLFHNCPVPSMKGLELPEGRTAKACHHILQRFKADYGKKPEGDAAVTNHNNGSGGLESAATSPVKKPTEAAKKRKAPESPSKKSTKKPKVCDAAEDSDHAEDTAV